MPNFTESSITLDFPDTNWFRLADCVGYRSLSGCSFKEMDACWYEEDANMYWLIELKDFSLASLSTNEGIEKRAWDIAKKAYDSICMFLAVKHGYTYSANLAPSFPKVPDENTVFKLIAIIHCDPSQRADVQLLHNSFCNKFKPYAELFDIKHYGVMEHSRAIAKLPYSMVK